MATRREIDDFIREDETPLSEPCEPVCECEYCGRGIREADEMVAIYGPEDSIRLCSYCWEAGHREVFQRELLDWLGVRYVTGWASEVEPVARNWDIERKRSRRIGA